MATTKGFSAGWIAEAMAVIVGIFVAVVLSTTIMEGSFGQARDMGRALLNPIFAGVVLLLHIPAAVPGLILARSARNKSVADAGSILIAGTTALLIALGMDLVVMTLLANAWG